MPYKPAQGEQAAPRSGHFALLMDTSGTRLAIRPGASLWLVEDASQMDKIFPLTLSKVSVGKLKFTMANADGGVSEYTYKLESSKPLNKLALDRFLKNRQDKPVKVQK